MFEKLYSTHEKVLSFVAGEVPVAVSSVAKAWTTLQSERAACREAYSDKVLTAYKQNLNAVAQVLSNNEKWLFYQCINFSEIFPDSVHKKLTVSSHLNLWSMRNKQSIL